MPYSKTPALDEYPPYYQAYIAKVIGAKDILAQLKKQQTLVIDMINTLSEEKLNYAYAEGKWTIKELLIHIIDTERIMTFRALSFARGEKNEIAGYDHDNYVKESYATTKSSMQLKEEYETNRKATIALFRGFDDKCVDRKGVANGQTISVRGLLYIIAGHELHHLQMLKELYL